MATIYLKHFLHGAKVATMELEAIADEKNGWVRFNPDEVELIEPVNALETKRRQLRKPADTSAEGF